MWVKKVSPLLTVTYFEIKFVKNLGQLTIIRDVLSTLLSIYDGALCENSVQLQAIN